ncbi:MAG TPA: hypothetical protein VL527_09620 [Dongiaceae bacterium]|nr:hypothetical protein [Dongiaceae bacterium]
MSNERVLYEAKLAKTGRNLTYGGWVVLALWTGVGAVFCFVFDSFPGRLIPLTIILLGSAGFALQILRVAKLRGNPGCYRISIDDFGLYVHSDDPASAPGFSIIAPDVYCLVRRTIRQAESSDDLEYYVETKSGKRHRLEQLFIDYDLNAMGLFEEIAERFPWVQIVEEVK